MSDDGYEYDYEYDIYSDEEIADDIADHVDALAEHTQYSPVLVNANPDFDVEYDDFEYLTDEYYDEVGPRESSGNTAGKQATESNSTSSKRKRVEVDEKVSSSRSKRRKIDAQERLTQHAPVIIWKSKDQERKSSVLKAGEGKEIALLVDWRELLEDAKQPSDDEEEAAAVAKVKKISHRAKEKQSIDVNKTKSTTKGEKRVVHSDKHQREENTPSVDLMVTPPPDDTPRRTRRR